MGDPKNYISPDVVVDFTTIQLEADGEDRVKVFGVKGRPSTPFFKVSMAYLDGFKARGSLIISGGHALEKAKLFDRIFWERLGESFEKKNTEFTGHNSTHLNLAEDISPNEILLRFTVYDNDKNKIRKFGENIAPIILSGPPGVAVTGGRPRPQSVMTYWPTLVPKSMVKTTVKLLDNEGNIENKFDVPTVLGGESEDTSVDTPSQRSEEVKPVSWPSEGETRKVKFEDICLARSGDKGDMVNIGVIARNEKVYSFLKDHLTADYMKAMFSSLCHGPVTRFELDNLNGLNFLLDHALDGGGTKSLMIDAQGKTFASAFLNQEVEVPVELLS
jgi:hypothetical protein